MPRRFFFFLLFSLVLSRPRLLRLSLSLVCRFPSLALIAVDDRHRDGTLYRTSFSLSLYLSISRAREEYPKTRRDELQQRAMQEERETRRRKEQVCVHVRTGGQTEGKSESTRGKRGEGEEERHGERNGRDGKIKRKGRGKKARKERNKKKSFSSEGFLIAERRREAEEKVSRSAEEASSRSWSYL